MENNRIYEERSLLNDIIEGNEHAFSILYERYDHRIYQFIIKYIHSPALAQDLTQDVFIKVWEHRDRLKEVRSFKAYLFIIARNHALNNLRSALTSKIAMGEVINNYTPVCNTVDEEIVDKEYAEFLKKILNSLPERTRTIFKLCREQGKTYEEVAKALGISKNAIKNHMVHSMKVLSLSVEKDLGISLILLLAILFIK